MIRVGPSSKPWRRVLPSTPCPVDLVFVFSALPLRPLRLRVEGKACVVPAEGAREKVTPHYRGNSVITTSVTPRLCDMVFEAVYPLHVSASLLLIGDTV
jgi:hypothetical protein